MATFTRAQCLKCDTDRYMKHLHTVITEGTGYAKVMLTCVTCKHGQEMRVSLRHYDTLTLADALRHAVPL